MGYYNILIVLGLLSLVFYLVYGNFKRKYKKVKLDPADVLLGALSLILLWYADVLVLGMSKFGFMTTSGVLNVVSNSTPAIFMYSLLILGILVITGWWTYENEFIIKEKVEKRFNRIVLCLLVFGNLLFLFTSVYMCFVGENKLLGGIRLFDLYHLSLPFIIIPSFLMMTERK